MNGKDAKELVKGKETSSLRDAIDRYLDIHPTARSFYSGISTGFNPFCDIPEELEIVCFDEEFEEGIFAMGLSPDNKTLALQRKQDIPPREELARLRNLIPRFIRDSSSVTEYDSRIKPEFASKLISFLPHEFIHYQLNAPLVQLLVLLGLNDLRSVGQFSSLFVFNELIVSLCVAEVLGISWDISIVDYKRYLFVSEYKKIVAQANELIKARSLKVTKQNEKRVFRKYMGRTNVGKEFENLVKVIVNARSQGIHPIDIGNIINYSVLDFVRNNNGSHFEVSFSAIASSIEYYIREEVLCKSLPHERKLLVENEVNPLAFEIYSRRFENLF